MNWANPRYEEIKMDAEIGSYQVDPDVPEREYAGVSHLADAPAKRRPAEAVSLAT
jgi:hypothetical protein